MFNITFSKLKKKKLFINNLKVRRRVFQNNFNSETWLSLHSETWLYAILCACIQYIFHFLYMIVQNSPLKYF